MSKFKKLVKRALGYVPRRLPLGMTEFNNWVADFKETYDLPTDNYDAILNVLATTVINIDDKKGPRTHVTNAYVYKVFLAGAQKEIAGAVFHELRVKYKAKSEAEKEAAKHAVQQ